MSESTLLVADERATHAKRLALVVYVLQAVSFVIPLTFIVGVVIDYAARERAAGTWVESHLRWQIRTFWYGVLWGLVGAASSLIYIGYAVLFVLSLWLIYRIARGWINLSAETPMY